MKTDLKGESSRQLTDNEEAIDLNGWILSFNIPSISNSFKFSNWVLIVTASLPHDTHLAT